jgi:hypothetical protein
MWHWYTSSGQLKSAVRNSTVVLNYRTTTASTPLTDSDSVLEVTNTTASVTVTLPTAVNRKGRVFSVLTHSAASLYPTTVATSSSETLNGDSDGMLLAQDYASVDLISTGTGWRIL